jgi:hypothetical protein
MSGRERERELEEEKVVTVERRAQIDSAHRTAIHRTPS